MSAWVVVHDQAELDYGQHKTKKAATAAAKEMTDAHAAIDARHNGEPITFSVEKRTVQLEQAPVVEDAPVEEEA